MPEQLEQPQRESVEQAPQQDGAEKPKLDIKPDDLKEAQKRAVKQWTTRINNAKKKFGDAFKRMRDNMSFASGLQWAGQNTIEDDRYVANMTIRTINQKVAILYARDPKSVARRRKRLDFQVWDGQVESLQQAMVGMMTNPLDIASQALMMDFAHGKQWEAMLDKVGKTLEILFQYQLDSQDVEFKLQAKQLVRRICTCGVGYVRVQFERMFDGPTDDNGTLGNTILDRGQRIKHLVEKLESKELDYCDATVEQIRLLTESLGASLQRGEQMELNERLEYHFPSSTAIIVDPNCRNLKGFVGANWVVEEFIVPLDEVNALFETDIKISLTGDGVQTYSETGQEQLVAINDDGQPDVKQKNLVCLWKVYDKRTKSCFHLVNGWKEYVSEPEPVYPDVPGFWPIRAIMFNDVESDPTTKASIYPPSDVDLMKSAQKEWNRTRETLRAHRKANQPNYIAGEGTVSETDKDVIKNAVPNEIIFLKQIPVGTDVTKVIVPVPKIPVDPAIYDTAPLTQDILQAVGQQEANLGPAKPNVTATVGNIAEQSRLTMSSSNVDDLDDLLTWLANVSGVAMLKEFSTETVKRIVGPGAVWPTQQKEDFINAIYLETLAASSGRPNKALDVSNFQQIAPLLVQAGANPIGVIEEGVRRLDDQLDVSKFFPVQLPQMGGGMPPSQQQGPQGNPKQGPPPPNPQNNGG